MNDLALAAAALMALGMIGRTLTGTWAAPGALFALYWVIQVALSSAVPDYRPAASAVWWIGLTVAVFQGGAAIGAALAGAATVSRGGVRFRHAEAALWIVTALGAGYVIGSEALGIDLSVDRPPLSIQALLPFCYLGPLIGGAVVASRSLTRRKWVAFMPLLPPFALGILFTGRTVVILPVVLWLATYLAVKVTRDSDARLFTPRRVLLFLVLAVAFTATALAIQRFRDVREAGAAVSVRLMTYADVMGSVEAAETWSKLRFAVFGTAYAFSNYFIDAWRQPPDPAWGAITFAGPLEFAGVGGIRYPFENFEIDPGVYTNLFSMLRPPIDDFGLWGSLAWWLAIGAVQGWAFAHARAADPTALLLLAWFYGDLGVTMSFRYNAVIVAYLGAWAYFVNAGQRVPFHRGSAHRSALAAAALQPCGARGTT